MKIFDPLMILDAPCFYLSGMFDKLLHSFCFEAASLCEYKYSHNWFDFLKMLLHGICYLFVTFLRRIGSMY